MVREYWEDQAGWYVYLSVDEDNAQLISSMTTKPVVTYLKNQKPVSYHFKMTEKQLKSLPLTTFKKVTTCQK